MQVPAYVGLLNRRARGLLASPADDVVAVSANGGERPMFETREV